MESLLMSTGYLLILFGLYLAFTGWNEDPLIKGVVAILLGVFLMVLAHFLVVRGEKKGKRRKGYEIA